MHMLAQTTQPIIPPGSPAWVTTAVQIIIGLGVILTVATVYLGPKIIAFIVALKGVVDATKATADSNSTRITSVSAHAVAIDGKVTDLAAAIPPSAVASVSSTATGSANRK